MLLSKRNPLPHYTLGDLGFIPRPDHNIPSFLNRTRDSTGGTHLRGLRRVLTHSVAVQTVNSSKVRISGHTRCDEFSLEVLVCFVRIVLSLLHQYLGLMALVVLPVSE